MTTKIQGMSYTTAEGKLTGYVCLIKPSTKYNSDGVYSADLLLPMSSKQQLMKCVHEVLKSFIISQSAGDENKFKSLKNKISLEKIVDVDEDTFKISVKQYAVTTGQKNTITFYDKHNEKITDINEIQHLGRNSIVSLHLYIRPYYTGGKIGITFYLKSCKIVEYVTYGNAQEYNPFSQNFSNMISEQNNNTFPESNEFDNMFNENKSPFGDTDIPF